MATRRELRIGFIGAGTVGRTLARALDGAGYTVVAVASRSLTSAQQLAMAIPDCEAYETAQDVADVASLVFITTPDSAIASVTTSVRWQPGQIVVHTSGRATVAELSAAKADGALVASLHPLQTFAEPGQALENIPGTTFALEGDDEALETLRPIVEAIGGCWITLRSGDKVIYHAAAVMISNYTVTLMHAATQLWRQFGIEREEATKALLPLLQGTVNNIERVGLPNCLTGPVARGDIATVRAHLDALGEQFPTLLPAYKELALQTIPVAIGKRSLDPASAEELGRVLAEHVSPKIGVHEGDDAV